MDSSIQDARDGLRVVTYNIHKCRGLDRVVSPERIAKVLREINADIIALQEVVGPEDGTSGGDHAEYIARHSGFACCLGENRKHEGRAYGNLLLSRFPLTAAFNYDITAEGREERGCLRVDIHFGGFLLHVFNVHLGTGFRERRRQGMQLLASEILNNSGLEGTRMILGDFNEWTPGLATRLLSEEFEGGERREGLRRRRSYPGILPLLRLDDIYVDPELQLQNIRLHRSRLALVASDHLPLVADFRLPAVQWSRSTKSAALTPALRPA